MLTELKKSLVVFVTIFMAASIVSAQVAALTPILNRSKDVLSKTQSDTAKAQRAFKEAKEYADQNPDDLQALDRVNMYQGLLKEAERRESTASKNVENITALITNKSGGASAAALINQANTFNATYTPVAQEFTPSHSTQVVAPRVIPQERPMELGPSDVASHSANPTPTSSAVPASMPSPVPSATPTPTPQTDRTPTPTSSTVSAKSTEEEMVDLAKEEADLSKEKGAVDKFMDVRKAALEDYEKTQKESEKAKKFAEENPGSEEAQKLAIEFKERERAAQKTWETAKEKYEAAKKELETKTEILDLKRTRLEYKTNLEGNQNALYQKSLKAQLDTLQESIDKKTANLTTDKISEMNTFSENYKPSYVAYKAPEIKSPMKVEVVDGNTETGSDGNGSNGNGSGGPLLITGGSGTGDSTNLTSTNTFTGDSGSGGGTTGGKTGGTTSVFQPTTGAVFDPVADKPKVKVILSSSKQ